MEKFRRWLFRVFLLPLLFCGCRTAFATGGYQTTEINSLKITIDSEWGNQGSPGYIPVRFDITNLGEARTIEVVGQGGRQIRSGSSLFGTSTSVQQTVNMKRGDRLRFTLPVPVFTDGESMRFEVRENGRAIESFSYFAFQGGMDNLQDISALVAADPSSALGKEAVNWLRVARSRGYVSRIPGPTRPAGYAPKLDFVLDPARLPANWLGFTSLAAVFIGPMEWQLLSDTQKTALLHWVACGGNLMLVDGDLKTLFPSQQNSGGASQNYFFGQIYFPPAHQLTEFGIEGVFRETVVTSISPWSLPANLGVGWGTIANRGFRLPIDGVGDVPIGAYLSILLLFTLLIGPVNYVILWRKRQQVLMVLTVPLISLAFIAVLAGYVVAGEGFSVHGRAETFTILDQASRQAATRTTVSLYPAGMSPYGGLSFPREMAVFPIGTDGHGSREPQILDLSDSQRFVSGIARARTPTNFEEIAFRPARERLTFNGAVNGDGARMDVVNGLDGTVLQLFYRNGTQTYEFSGRLQPGEKATLEGHPSQPKPMVFAAAKPVMLSGLKYQGILESQPDRSYLAVLEHSPFWDAGVSGVQEKGSFHLVLGYVEAGL